MRKKFSIAVLFIIVIALGVTSCKTSKIDMDEFEEITLEQFEDAMEKIYERGISHYGSSSDPINTVSDPPLCLEHYSSEDFEEVRILFEEQYNHFTHYCEENPNEVMMGIDEDRGFIIYNIIGTDRIAEATGYSEHELYFARNLVYFVPQIGFENDYPEPDDERIHDENVRRYGVIYYCGSTYIDFSFNADKEESLDQFNEFLDELGLPHM